jgi:hypothetical protein
MVGIEGACEKQAELTFAIARHAVVDLAQVFNTSPQQLAADRLPPAELRRIRDVLAKHGLKLNDGEVADTRLTELRRMYEPYIYALASYLNQSLPPWIPQKKGKDNWQTTAWGQTAGFVERQTAVAVDEHF